MAQWPSGGCLHIARRSGKSFAAEYSFYMSLLCIEEDEDGCVCHQ